MKLIILFKDFFYNYEYDNYIKINSLKINIFIMNLMFKNIKLRNTKLFYFLNLLNLFFDLIMNDKKINFNIFFVICNVFVFYIFVFYILIKYLLNFLNSLNN